MEPWRVKRDDVTFNIWIGAYCKLRRLDYSLSVWGKMIKLSFQPTVFTFYTLINGFCIGGKISKSREMIEIGKVAYINVYTTIIIEFHIIGILMELKMLEERGPNPNVITYNTGNKEKGKAIGLAKSILEGMFYESPAGAGERTVRFLAFEQILQEFANVCARAILRGLKNVGAVDGHDIRERIISVGE
ncbi:hypothetical protein Gohar_001716, partial [Gossypium harknessii]|nr:hypothetical protein [Gossypium harknessii]